MSIRYPVTAEEREKKRAYERAYREAHRERIRELKRMSRDRLREQINQRRRERYQQNEGGVRDAMLLKLKRYREEHPERIRATKAKYARSERGKQVHRDSTARQTAKLTDGYIARRLMRVPVRELPLEVIEAKRAIIQVKRLLGVTSYQGGTR